MAARVVPYLFYKNGKAAIDFIAKAFGFEVRMVMPGPGDSVMHAELAIGDAVVYLGTPAGQKPARLQPQRTAATLVYVDDVDAHCARAREAGAKILVEPRDEFYGDRVYNAADPEGQEWYFHQHVRDVSAAEMQAALAGVSGRPRESANPAKTRAAKRTAKPKRKTAKSKTAKKK